MIKKTVIMLLMAIMTLSFTGCVEHKIDNTSILVYAKIESLENHGGKIPYLKVSTDKGDFYMPNNEYYDQLIDLYKLQKNNGKDLIVDIIYDNSDYYIKNDMHQINEIVVVEQ